MKRILLALPAALLIYSALLIWSFWGNRELEQGVLAPPRGIDSLKSLDTLRETLANLNKWSDRAPLRLSFGLYKGNDIREDVRKIYYARFRTLLFESAQQRMLDDMQTSTPGDDYHVRFDALKSYLLTTSEWKRTTDTALQSFLRSQLETRWAADTEALARAQFDFYVSDLHNANPFSVVADAAAVRRARFYLSKFPARQQPGEHWVLSPDQGKN